MSTATSSAPSTPIPRIAQASTPRGGAVGVPSNHSQPPAIRVQSTSTIPPARQTATAHPPAPPSHHGRRIPPSTPTVSSPLISNGNHNLRQTNPSTPVATSATPSSRPVNTPSTHTNAVASSSRTRLDSVSRRSAGPSGVSSQTKRPKEDEDHAAKVVLGKRKRTSEEDAVIRDSTEEIRSNLTLDQSLLTSFSTSTDYIDPSPFTSFANIVDRLLPWHVWQVHDEDLVSSRRGSGMGEEYVGMKGAAGSGLGVEEATRREKETARVTELVNRQMAIEKRVKALRNKSKNTPDTILTTMQLTTAVIPTIRNEIVSTQQTYRELRAEADRLHAIKRSRQLEEARRSEEIARRAALERMRKAEREATQGSGTATPTTASTGVALTQQSTGTPTRVVPAQNPTATPTAAQASSVRTTNAPLPKSLTSSTTPRSATQASTPAASTTVNVMLPVDKVPGATKLGIFAPPTGAILPHGTAYPGVFKDYTKGGKVANVSVQLHKLSKTQMDYLVHVMGTPPPR